MTRKLIFGFHAVTVRLKTAPASVVEVHVDAQRRDARMRQFVERVQAAGTRLMDSDDARLSRLAGGGRHQGVVAFVLPLKAQHSMDDILDDVEARADGPPLVLVLDGRGRVLGWELGQKDRPIKQIATNFITSLSQGRVVDARSLLIRDLQDEITPQDLLNRWKDLEKLTGSFQRLRGTVVASEGGPQQLVLVTTEFQRVTDNLFVIFDNQGHIIGVDFPEDPARPGTPLP